MGKKVIAVPRYHKYGEHVNDHQLQIVQTFDGQGFIKGIKDVCELKEVIRNEDSDSLNLKKLLDLICEDYELHKKD